MVKNTSIYQLLKSQAAQRPNAIAIKSLDKKSLNYRQLYGHAQDVVRQLNVMGIGRNDPVAIVLPNGPLMAAAFLCVASGAACAPLNPAYQSKEFEYFLSDLGAKAVITISVPDSLIIKAAAKLNTPVVLLRETQDNLAGTFTLTGPVHPLTGQGGPAQADDVALFLHTSGTTSRPKLVPLTHRNLLSSAVNICQTLRLDPSDCCLNIMPLIHIHGLMAALTASMNAGASVVCTSGLDAPRFFDWLDNERPSWYTAVPTMHQAILLRAPDSEEILNRVSLRFIRSSSSSLPPQVMEDLERTFETAVVEAYGMTEASHQIASNPLPPGVRKAGSVGKAAGPDVAIMAEESNELLSRGEIGEIVLRGVNITTGYAGNPEANATTFVDGWFRTGDQGYIDQDGYVYITGRLKEIINRGGEKIAPREIDEVLLKHPAVNQAIAFAMPDELLGEDVAAAVVLRHDMSATEQEVRRFVGQHLANFKIPRVIIFLDEIPKGPTGKLQRVGLADKLKTTNSQKADTHKAASIVEPATPLEESLLRIWKQVLEIDEISVNDQFFDVGGDSLLATKLIMSIRRELDVDLPPVELFEASTIRDQANLIKKQEQTNI